MGVYHIQSDFLNLTGFPKNKFFFHFFKTFRLKQSMISAKSIIMKHIKNGNRSRIYENLGKSHRHHDPKILQMKSRMSLNIIITEWFMIKLKKHSTVIQLLALRNNLWLFENHLFYIINCKILTILIILNTIMQLRFYWPIGVNG